MFPIAVNPSIFRFSQVFIDFLAGRTSNDVISRNRRKALLE